MDSMKSRLLTAAIGIPFAVVVLILGEIFHAVMYVVCALICAFMVIELLSAKKLHKKLFVLVFKVGSMELLSQGVCKVVVYPVFIAGSSTGASADHR